MAGGGESTGTARLVAVGRVRRAHGVRGVLVVESLTPSPEAVFQPGRRVIAGSPRGAPLTPARDLSVEWAEPFQGGFRIQFAEIRDRDEADRWRDRRLLLPAAELPPAEAVPGPGELVGLDVVRENGEAVGVVAAYYDLPHDLLIEVARPGGDTVLIPWRDGFVVGVAMAARRIVVAPPDGLL